MFCIFLMCLSQQKGFATFQLKIGQFSGSDTLSISLRTFCRFKIHVGSKLLPPHQLVTQFIPHVHPNTIVGHIFLIWGFNFLPSPHTIHVIIMYQAPWYFILSLELAIQYIKYSVVFYKYLIYLDKLWVLCVANTDTYVYLDKVSKGNP